MEKITYLNTPEFNDWSYDDYKSFCADNGIEPGDENSNDYYTFLSERTAEDVDDFFMNLEDSPEDHRPCIISGSLGLWWGQPEIEPVRCDSLTEAIKKCIDDRSCQDFRLELEDGKISVAVYHHDGCNSFTIKPEAGTWPEYLF